jgi:hypothetical protein
MPFKTQEQKREYARLYYHKNKDKIVQQNKCEHDKRRSHCKECKGSQICEHDRIHSQCKDCKGGSICEHDKRRSECKDCKGGSICEHDRIHSQCKDCKGSGICKHDKRRSHCKECKGSQICEHDRERNRCKDCKGSGICEHDRRRSRCKECKGSEICEHDRDRPRCKDCKGGSICEHERIRFQCKDCLSTLAYLVILQRSAMNRMFRHTYTGKTNTSITYLGCSVQYFKEYIEKKMTSEMNWENIHLDHIKPVSKFNLQYHEDFLDCCHYTNFQPLLVATNLKKSNKWSDENEAFWQEHIKGKEYNQLYLF